MRRKIAGPVKVRAGQRVHFTMALHKRANHGFVTVFALEGKGDPSPYVDQSKIGILSKGRPILTAPISYRLNRETRPSLTTSMVIDTDCKLFLMEDADLVTDPKIKARIRKDGKIRNFLSSACRWIR